MFFAGSGIAAAGGGVGGDGGVLNVTVDTQASGAPSGAFETGAGPETGLTAGNGFAAEVQFLMIDHGMPAASFANTPGTWPWLMVGDITAVTLFQAALPTPVQRLALEPERRAATFAGQRTFDSIGCSGCHVQRMVLHSRIFTEPNPYNPVGNLRPGDVPAPPRPTDEFLTRKLWDAGSSDPYGHRGDLTTLTDAIYYHGGEARESRDQFFGLTQEDRNAVIEFLKSLQVM